MNRPPQPRMMNNFHRGPMPYNHQWRPSQGPRPPPRFSRNNPHFGAPVMRTENSDLHWCESCDRSFPTTDLLQQHMQQHRKCNIDGCQFTAHPKVITKHIQNTHSNGLFKKIANLNNPEAIQKWREERKKKFPTKSNIEKKHAESKEKIERGEKMALKRDYRNDKHGSTAQGPNLKRKHSFDKKNQRITRQNFKTSSPLTTNSQPAKKKPRVIPSAPATSEKNKLKPFAGIVNIEMDQNAEDISEPLEHSIVLIEDDDEEALVIPKKTTDTQKPVLCGALTSLICDYGTSDEEPEENEVINKLSVIQPCQTLVQPPNRDNSKINMPVDDKGKLVENKESNDEGPEGIKILKTNVEYDTAPETIIKTSKINIPVDDKAKLVENKESDDEGPEEVKIVKTKVELDTAPETIVKTSKINIPVEDKAKLVENKESDDEGPEEVKIVKTKVELDTAPETIVKTSKINIPVEDKAKLVENKESDDEGPEEVKIVKTKVELDTAPETIIKTKEKPVKTIMPPRKPERQNYNFKRNIPSTLLQKLLHNEIRKERNIVLQCIRYIKKCNYFEKPNQ